MPIIFDVRVKYSTREVVPDIVGKDLRVIIGVPCLSCSSGASILAYKAVDEDHTEIVVVEDLPVQMIHV